MIVVEPGDATRYEIHISDEDDTVSVWDGDPVMIPSGFVSPSDLGDLNDNIVTRAVVADVVNHRRGMASYWHWHVRRGHSEFRPGIDLVDITK